MDNIDNIIAAGATAYRFNKYTDEAPDRVELNSEKIKELIEYCELQAMGDRLVVESAKHIYIFDDTRFAALAYA